MTQHHDDAFTPDTVDERVDQLTSLAPQSSPPPSTRIVQRLHALYEEDQLATERVWERLARHVNEHDDSSLASEYRQPGTLSGIQEGRGFMQQGILSPRKTGPARFLLIAAALFATLLVSSMLWAAHITPFTQLAEPVNPIVAGQTVPSSPPGIYLTKPGEISRLDVQTRKVIWRTSIPAKVAAMTKYAGEPVVIGNTVYLTNGNIVLAFDASKGTFRWSNKFDANVGNLSTENGVLYVSPMSGLGDKLYAIDPTNGKIKTTYTSPQGMWSPIVLNGVVYYASGPSLYAQRLTNKKLLWHQQIQAGQSLEFVSVNNGIVYSSAMTTTPPKGITTVGLLYVFDAKTGKPLWKSSTVPFGVGNFLATNDMVYCASFSGDLDTFDSHTGKHIWSLHSNTYDLLASAGVLYINYNKNTASGSGGIEALQAKSGNKLWQRSFTGSNYHYLFGLQHGILYTIDSKVGSIDALKASDGTRLWHLSVNSGAGAAVA